MPFDHSQDKNKEKRSREELMKDDSGANPLFYNPEKFVSEDL